MVKVGELLMLPTGHIPSDIKLGLMY